MFSTCFLLEYAGEARETSRSPGSGVALDIEPSNGGGGLHLRTRLTARSFGVVADPLVEVLASIGQRRLSVCGGDLRAREIGHESVDLGDGHPTNIIPLFAMREGNDVCSADARGGDDQIGFSLRDLDRLVVSHNTRIARHPAGGSPVDRSGRIARLMGSTH